MKLKDKELFKLSNENETHYFTSLYRIGQFVGMQRAQVEYCALRGKTIKGWTIDTVDDCGDVPFKWINPTHEDIENNKNI